MTVRLSQVTTDDVVVNNIKNKSNSDKVKMYSRLRVGVEEYASC